MTPFHLYVHVPFCKARCPYCAFYFVVGRRDARDSYVDAVRGEIAAAAGDGRFAGRAVASVYFGGGTPSLLAPAAIDGILAAVRETFPVEAGAEISLEANPDGLTVETLRDLRRAGLSRLTLGWQSLRADDLRGLGRTHAPGDTGRSLDAAREAGIPNVGVDLMFGLPGRSPEDWRRDLERVAAMAPDHVSAYELTVEEGTKFFRRREAGRLTLPDEDARADMFEATDDVLAGAGIRRYEISNFARPGMECVHNTGGWRGGDLLGVGASAASHVRNVRWTNVADLDEYVARRSRGDATAEPPEILDEETWAAEDLYLGLRLVDGLDADARLSQVPDGAPRLQAALADAERRGLLERGGDGIRLTRRGRLLADEVFSALLAPDR
ncbi:MAG TPA: radical SAM family heme chaperone HemW [bacterium]|nr:radical SAM family heme chaperone HemW [bacterium]